MGDRIAIIGLGYVGLPVALAFAKKFPGTIGFDTNIHKVNTLKGGVDPSHQISNENLKTSNLYITADPAELLGIKFFIVAVPTPIDRNNRPDLTCLIKASETIGKVLKPGSIIVYESTVYPGVTEDICGPVLAKLSGLQQGIDFKLGYSPERINPGDRVHTLENLVKVVAGEDAETLERVANVYGSIIDAGVYRAPSIKIAEAAKVIENTQRDLNIALMNELALICDRLGIRTWDVLATAKTKWNFLPFTPGLVGGHCIGVDPYYLTTKAEELGYHPQVILAGRRINDSMGTYLGQRLVKLLVQANLPIKGSRIGILGLTFKENVPDLRNSRVPDIVAELQQFGVEPLVHDPLVDPDEAQRYYNIDLVPWQALSDLEGLILAVSHQVYLDMPSAQLLTCLRSGGVLMDVKSVLDPATLPSTIHYWSL
ncbi:nucleotide sugar dehydrogenase [Trichocoleus sp. DQ-U1]|uniref:nucleotide sugar dehydrogenase n=1 Tax=Trichocoleus sp. DQ-U1 TaxID=2933926 RepID=UPI003298CCD2